MQRIPSRSCLVIFVSLLWLLSIMAPPVLQLLDEQSSSVAYSLNEEESKEQEYNDSGEETLLSPSQELQEHPFLSQSLTIGLRHSQAAGAFYLEIQLPPPEANF